MVNNLINLLPGVYRGYNNVQPFSYRDSLTHAEVIENLADYVAETLIPHIDTESAALVEAWRENVEKMIVDVGAVLIVQDASVDDKIAELIALVNTEVDKVVGSGAVVNDPIIKNVLSNIASASRVYVDTLYASKATETTISTGRLSATTLDGRFTAAATAATAVDTKANNNATAIGATNTIVAGLTAKTATLPTLIPAGSTVAQINALIAATPDGGEVVFPNAAFAMASSIVNPPGKSLTFDARQATFTQTTAAPVVDFTATWTPSKSVVSAVPGTLAIGDTFVESLVVTLSTVAPAWGRGTLVKMWGDSLVLGSMTDLPVPPTLAYRAGQFFSVYSSVGSVVTLVGRLREPITGGVMLAKPSNEKIVWNGGRFISTYVGDSKMLSFNSLTSPVVSNVSVEGASGQATSFVSCMGYLVDNCTVNYAIDDGVAYGYGVDDNSSEFGVVRSSRFFQTRHAYTTTATPSAVGEDSPARHGRSYGTSISDCSAIANTSAGFDTHSNAQSITFLNCTAIDSPVGLQLRGIGNTIADATVRNCRGGIRIASDSASGESWGHVVDGAKIDDCSEYAVQVVTRHGGGHPNKGVRDIRKTNLFNITATGLVLRGLSLLNTTVVASGLRFDFVGASDGARSLVAVENSNLKISGGMFLDVTGVSTQASGCALFLVNGVSGSLEADKVRATGGSPMAARVDKLIANDGAAILRVDDILVDSLPTSGTYVDATTATGWAHYRATAASSATSSHGVLTVATDRVTLANLIARTTGTVVAQFNLSGAQTLDQLPTARSGQILLITNIGTGALTVNNGATPRTALIGATTKVLASNDSLMLVWDNAVWRQVKLV